MKKSITIVTILTILISCKETTTKQKAENASTPVIVEKTTAPKKVKNSEQSEINTKKNEEKFEKAEEKGVFIPEKQLKNIILDFQNCKDVSENRSDCRNKLTAFIGKAYKANEFKNTEQQYVIYDSILPIISRSNKWKNIGVATDQTVINDAVSHANKGKLALVIDTSQAYGHIVVIVPGSTKKSGSWGIRLPVSVR